MNTKALLTITALILVFSGCEKKSYKAKVSTPKGKKAEEILSNLNEPKSGYECELEVLDTGAKSKVFYLDRSAKNPKSALFHKLYTVNEDGKSVDANVSIGSSKLYLLPYQSENDSIYKSSALASVSKETRKSKGSDGMTYLSSNARISFDSKVNEFDIQIVDKSFDEKELSMVSTVVNTAKIANCSEAEMKVPLGLD